MRVTLSWDIANADPAIRAWRIYGNPEPGLRARGRFLRELPATERDTTFDVEEGEWEFRVLGVKRDETETPWETASSTKSGLFFGRGVKTQPDAPEEIGGGLTGDGGLRVEVKTRAPDEQLNKVQLIGGPPASVYSIAGPGFGHLLGEFPEARADLLADDAGRVLSADFRLDGQGMTTDRRLWVRAMGYDGTPSTATERTLYPPERGNFDARVVASVNGAAGTYSGFAAPGATDGWEAAATYGFRAKKLPLVGSADWSDWGAVGGSGLFSSLLTIGRYLDNAKIQTDEVDLGASMLFQLDTYHEAHRRDSAWGTKTLREWNSVPGIPGEHRRMRHDRPHAGWTMREVLVGGEPRQPIRDVWWEYVASNSTPVSTAEDDWARLVPGQWIRARYFRVRLRFEEPLPWFRFATGNVQVAVLRPRTTSSSTGSPEGVVAGPRGMFYVDESTTPDTLYFKTTQTGNTGWIAVEEDGAATAAVVAHLAVSNPHSQYQLQAAKDTAGGYAGLNGSTKIPVALLSLMVGDAGAGGTAGLVPTPMAGDASKYLKGDGTWGAVGGGSTPTGTGFRHVTAGVEDGASALVTEADQSTSDVTTQDVTSTKHGYAPKSPGDSSKFLDGSATPAWSTAPGRLRAVYVYGSGTGATHTPASGTTLCAILAIGAGAGGGGGDITVGIGAGGGGGAGAVVRKLWTVSGNITYTVGALGGGGAAGNNAGTDGGDTTLSGTGLAITAKGGKGGASMAAGTTFTSAAGGATQAGTTGGDVSAPPAPGFAGRRFNGTLCFGGDGAGGPMGGGGAGATVNADGGAATGYGAGGGGGSAQSGADRAGGDGTGGLIVIEEYW